MVLATKLPNKYVVLWGVHGESGVHEDIVGSDDDDDNIAGYDATPLAQVCAVLGKLQRQDVLLSSADDDGWWKGGAMERIATAATATNAYKIALETHTTRASNGAWLRPMLILRL